MSLATEWNKQVPFSTASVTFDLNITSFGLYEYKFINPVFSKVNITDAIWYEGKGATLMR